MIRAFKEEDTETVIRIWLAASVRSHSFIDKAYWEEKAEAMRTLYLPLSEIVVDEDRTTGEVVAFMAFVEDYLAALFVAPAHQKRGVGSRLLALAQKDARHIGSYCLCGKRTGSRLLPKKRVPYNR